VSIIVSAVISLAATAGALIWRPYFGLFTFIVCAVLTSAHMSGTYRRYKRIAKLAGEIDTMLHGSANMSPDLYAEGELAILASEIYKLTVKLREQQQRLLSDKRFLADSIADISHQIRTPLTSINLIVSFLSAAELSDERRAELTRELVVLMKRIDWLINALLKMSRLDAGTIIFRKDRISMEDLLEKASEPLIIPVELRGLSLKKEASGGFEGDIPWTCEALGNILKNCMEHTPRGGTLSISARENALYSEIVIEDNGTGIDPEDLPHIFERFYRGKKPNPEGIGIGLALSRMIIAAQGGVIKAENKLTGGTMFTIRFYKGIV
jgi:signal transduction histidine kinase